MSEFLREYCETFGVWDPRPHKRVKPCLSK